MLTLDFETNTEIPLNPTEEPSPVQKPGSLQSVRASYRLNGKNFLKWSQFVRTYLKGKGGLNHLLEKGPDKKDPKFSSAYGMKKTPCPCPGCGILWNQHLVTPVFSWVPQRRFGTSLIVFVHTQRHKMLPKCMRLR